MEDLQFDEYQKAAATTAIYHKSIDEYIDTLEIPNPENKVKLHKLLCICYSVLGLVGEAGEVAGKLKKVIRDNKAEITTGVKMDLGKETGDTQWYVSAVASDLDLFLAEIAGHNIRKLQDRKERGVIGGSGDNR